MLVELESSSSCNFSRSFFNVIFKGLHFSFLTQYGTEMALIFISVIFHGIPLLFGCHL